MQNMSSQITLTLIDSKIQRIKAVLGEKSGQQPDSGKLQDEIIDIRKQLMQTIAELDSSKEREEKLNQLVANLYQRISMKGAIS